MVHWGSLWSGMNDICRRCGECGMGCDNACWCLCKSDDGGIHQLKGGMSCCGGWMRSIGVPSKTAASAVVGMAVGLWPAEMSPMSGTIKCGVWSVPSGVGVLMPWMRSVLVAWCSWGRNPVWTVLHKVARFITVITLGTGAVAAKITCLSMNQTSVISGHHIDHRGCQCGC